MRRAESREVNKELILKGFENSTKYVRYCD
jgi:hypothetical protein